MKVVSWPFKVSGHKDLTAHEIWLKTRRGDIQEREYYPDIFCDSNLLVNSGKETSTFFISRQSIIAQSKPSENTQA